MYGKARAYLAGMRMLYCMGGDTRARERYSAAAGSLTRLQLQNCTAQYTEQSEWSSILGQLRATMRCRYGVRRDILRKLTTVVSLHPSKAEVTQRNRTTPYRFAIKHGLIKFLSLDYIA